MIKCLLMLCESEQGTKPQCNHYNRAEKKLPYRFLGD